MPRKRQAGSRKHFMLILGPAVLITLAGFVVASYFIDPAPPRRITMVTGGEEGAYYLFGLRYQEILARHGIALEVRTSTGSIENIQLLDQDRDHADVALVQGGTEQDAVPDDLVSLGSLYYEPLWIFHRADLKIERLPDLRAKRISIGEHGSGTRAVVSQLLEANGIAPTSPGIESLGSDAAARALRAGDLDAAFFVTAPESPLVQELLRTPGLALMSLDRAAAYARRCRFLSQVTLPQGVIDLEANLPPRDVTLLAPTANLVVRADFHPALIDLLLQATAEVHSPGGLFERPGQFPSSEYVAFPLSKEAQRHLESGPPFLQRYLPFWAATLVDRLKVMLVPLIAMLLPLVKTMPLTYQWRIRSRIYRWYRELEPVESASLAGEPPPEIDDRLTELDRIEREVAKLSVPLSYREKVYDLRLHINLVRTQLRSLQAGRGRADE